MKPYYRPATSRDAVLVANNLREEDRMEIEGLGQHPLVLPFCVLSSDAPVAFFNSEGELAGVAGIMPDEREHVGQVWMICTPAVQKNPHHLVRQAKKWLDEQRNYRLLWNLADARNLFHQKLLRLLGFKALTARPVGPYGLPYLEIVKLCASP